VFTSVPECTRITSADSKADMTNSTEYGPPLKRKAVLSHHSIEARVPPDATMLDERGRIASQLSEALQFPTWSISDDSVNLQSKDGNRAVFVSHRNYGVFVDDPKDLPQLIEQTARILNTLLKVARPGREFIRFGVRHQFLLLVEDSLEDVLSRYKKKFNCITHHYESVLGGKIDDIGFPVWMSDSVGSFKTMAGPMPRQQMASFVRRNSSVYTDAGIFFDIDYSKGDGQTGFAEPALQLTEKLLKGGYEKWERYIDAIGGVSS
jgi:hypothetical protein